MPGMQCVHSVCTRSGARCFSKLFEFAFSVNVLYLGTLECGAILYGSGERKTSLNSNLTVLPSLSENVQENGSPGGQERGCGVPLTCKLFKCSFCTIKVNDAYI